MTAARVPVCVAVAPYHHVRELVSGAVELAGIAPEFVAPGTPGAEIVDLGLAEYVTARLRGEHELTAVPVFCHRAFVQSWLHEDSEPSSPLRLAPPSAAATIYGRALAADLPDGPAADALVVAPRSLTAGVARLRPLVDDPVAAEQEAFAQTGVYPILSVLAVRTELLQRERWLGSNVFRAFEVARRRYFARLADIRGSRAPIPSVAGHVATVAGVLGPELAPSGLDANRPTLEAFVAAAAAQELIAHAPEDVAELFADVEPFVDFTDGV